MGASSSTRRSRASARRRPASSGGTGPTSSGSFPTSPAADRIACMDAKQLEGVGFFSGLSKQELKRLAQWTDEISVGAGDRLATEGEFAHEFFVIAEGSADVTHDGRTIAELGPGDF